MTKFRILDLNVFLEFIVLISSLRFPHDQHSVERRMIHNLVLAGKAFILF